MLTATQRETITDILVGFGEVIKDAGPQGVPSGVLYAMLCDKLSLERYQQIITLMVKMRLVRVQFHVLYWIG